MTEDEVLPAEQAEQRLRRVPIRPWHAILALALVPVVLITIHLLRPQEEEPVLTSADLSRHREIWQEKGPESYNLEIVFNTLPLGDTRYYLEVRNGEVETITRDGRESPESNERYWTVGHQFEVIAQDLAAWERQMAVDPQIKYQIRYYAEFDPEYGFIRYFRKEARGPENFNWRVVDFAPLP